MGRKKKPIMSWDASEIMNNQVKYLIECIESDPDHQYYNLVGEDGKPDEDKIWEYVYEDSDLLTIEWDYILEYLTEIINKKSPSGCWKVEVANFGWRGVGGEQYLFADDGENFLRQILPNTDCTFYVYHDGKGLKINNFHHDSPVDKEWYYAKPIAYSTYEKFRGQYR